MVINNAIRKNRRNILIKAAVGISGALITPILVGAVATLMILDLAALNTDWSKVWLNRAVREQLGLPPDHGKNRK